MFASPVAAPSPADHHCRSVADAQVVIINHQAGSNKDTHLSFQTWKAAQASWSIAGQEEFDLTRATVYLCTGIRRSIWSIVI